MERFRKRYESLHHLQDDTSSERSRAASDCVKPSTRLPARALPDRRYGYFGFGVAIFITAFSLTTFSLILRNIPGWMPTSYGLHINTLETAMSCDLIISGDTSVLERAFTINLRSPAQFSFATAKGIDVAWDLFIGQGGRLLLAWISYIVFMDGLTRLLETSTVSYQLYATMVFDTTSLGSAWSSLKAVFTGHGWRGRAFLAWFFAASVYVLGFPTLISAATGYVTATTADIGILNDAIISSTSSEIVYCFNVTMLYSLIGLDNDPISFGPSIKEFRLDDLHDKLDTSLATTYPSFVATYKQYNSIFPYNGPPFDGINVTGYSGDGIENTFTSNITVNGTSWKFNNYDPLRDFHLGYCYRNQTLPDDLSKIATCVPASYFVWGFSSLLLYIICSLQIVWTVGMFIVWLDANINSQLCRTGRTTRGSLRAALDIAEAMREVLGEESCTYQNAEIDRALEKMRVGVQYYATDVNGFGVSHIGLSSTRSGQLSLRNGTIYGGSIASREPS